MVLLAALLPASVAAGTGSIGGTVTGPTGGPLVGIEVQACTLAPSDFGCWSATTAYDGTYAVSSLDPGGYALAYMDPSGTYPDVVYDNTKPGNAAYASLEDGTQVTVGSGPVTGINVQIPAGFHLMGRITGPDGQPIANARVAGYSSVGQGRSITATDGTYRMTVGLGDYSVQVAPSPPLPRGFYSDTGFTLFMESATPVTVTSGDVSGVDIRVPVGHWLKGRLTDPDGRPVSDTWAWICAPGTPRCMPADHMPGGTFAALVPPGAYELLVENYSGAWVSGYYASKGGGLVDPGLAATLTVGTGDLLGINARVDRLLVPTFVVGSTIGSTVPFRVSWGTMRAQGGTPWYAVERSIDGSAFAKLTLPRATATSLTVALTPGRRYQYRERGGVADAGGATVGAWQNGPVVRPVISQESAAAISYSGAWATATATSASGGRTRYATRAGASATFRFSGRAVALVAPKGPAMGSAKVYVDGVYLRTISLRASTARSRQVVVTDSWATSGSHSIKVVVVGTSGHPRVEVDAFVVLR